MGAPWFSFLASPCFSRDKHIPAPTIGALPNAQKDHPVSIEFCAAVKQATREKEHPGWLLFATAS